MSPMCAGLVPEAQLRRQCTWLGPSWTWLLETRVLSIVDIRGQRLTALDVGCGPGLVMEHLAPLFEVRGVDMEREEVRRCAGRGLDVIQARAESLPFEDGAFDVVYCSYLLLWVDDPEVVVHEMARVARSWVICLAEPDYLGRIGHPPQINTLDKALVKGVKRMGADPSMGRRLSGLFTSSGLMPEVGIYAGTWTAELMREEAEREWEEMVHVMADTLNGEELSVVKRAWDRAAKDGSLVQYNPVFYALANKRA